MPVGDLREIAAFGSAREAAVVVEFQRRRCRPFLDTESLLALAFRAMEPESLTSAIAPIVLVSAAGLLFNGVQAKNLHLSDRIRALAAEFRNPATTPERSQHIREELALLNRRIRLSQRALELIYIAILSFVLTSLLLASSMWMGARALLLATSAIFVAGVVLLIVALALEFIEMWIGLKTIEIEMRAVRGNMS